PDAPAPRTWGHRRPVILFSSEPDRLRAVLAAGHRQSEVGMRARDVRAIAFCSITTVLVLALSWLLLGSPLVSLALTGAYAVWLLTRPRMQRVIGRLRGEPDWSGYFSNRE